MDCATRAGITTLAGERNVDAVVDTIERRPAYNAGNADSVNTYRGGGAGEVRPEERVEGEFAGVTSRGEVCIGDAVVEAEADRNCTPVGGMGGVAGLDGGGVARISGEDIAIRIGFVVVVTDCAAKDGEGGVRSICRNTCALHHAIVSKCSFTNSPSISSICIYTILWFSQIHDDNTSMSHFSINADATFLATISERAVRQSDVS